MIKYCPHCGLELPDAARCTACPQYKTRIDRTVEMTPEQLAVLQKR